jgi:hypothetical protein
VTLVLFRTRRRDECLRPKEGVGVVFEKALASLGDKEFSYRNQQDGLDFSVHARENFQQATRCMRCGSAL